MTAPFVLSSKYISLCMDDNSVKSRINQLLFHLNVLARALLISKDSCVWTFLCTIYFMKFLFFKIIHLFIALSNSFRYSIYSITCERFINMKGICTIENWTRFVRNLFLQNLIFLFFFFLTMKTLLKCLKINVNIRLKNRYLYENYYGYYSIFNSYS